MSLVAQALEAAGIATVVIGSAMDIVERCGAPRFLYTDLPLGNSCGPPWDREAQAEIAALALDLLENATAARTIEIAPHVWPGNQEWRWRFHYSGPDNDEELKQLGDARRKLRARHKAEAGY